MKCVGRWGERKEIPELTRPDQQLCLPGAAGSASSGYASNYKTTSQLDFGPAQLSSLKDGKAPLTWITYFLRAQLIYNLVIAHCCIRATRPLGDVLTL